jgi:hypothetical protein
MTGMEAMMTATEEENRRLQVANCMGGSERVGKNPGLKKTGFLGGFLGYFGFLVFWFFFGFWVVFIYLPRREGFFSFKNTLGASRL